mmetsp:Transcript_127170/g.225403  ORF Transcript_127170/g.225403 Transcript_127170/m.225403 type:complete len:164 (-) Transcript_127170:64-555(-)
MMDDAQNDSAQVIDHMIEKEQDYIDKLVAVYQAIDENGDGEITYDEFCAQCASAELHAFVRSMGIEVTDAKHFFRVISGGGKRPVDAQCFVEGCIKMKGMARSMDLMDLVYQHKVAVLDQSTRMNAMQKNIDQLARACDRLSVSLSTTTNSCCKESSLALRSI